MTITASFANDETAASSIRCPATVSFVIPVSAVMSSGNDTDGSLNDLNAHLRRDNVLSIGLVVIGCELRQEFVVGDARRGVQACLSLDLPADPQRHVSGQKFSVTSR
jgi:hypothetical protein